MYGSETMIRIIRKEERSRIKAVQIDNLRCLLGMGRKDEAPNAQIKALCKVTKGLMKVFSDGLAMWREYRMTGLLRGSM